MHTYKSRKRKYVARQYSDSSQLSRCKPTQSVTLTPNLSEGCLLSLLSHSLNLSAEYWNITPTYTYGKSSCTHSACCCIFHSYSVPTQWFKVIALAVQLSSAGLRPHIFTASKSVRHIYHRQLDVVCGTSEALDIRHYETWLYFWRITC